MQRRGYRPERDRHGVAGARPEAVDELARKQEPSHVSDLESAGDVAVDLVIEVDIVADFPSQNGEDDAVEIIQGSAEEQKPQHPPARAGHSHRVF